MKKGNWILRLTFVAICLQFSIFNFQFSICSAQPRQRRVTQPVQQQGSQPRSQQQQNTQQGGMTQRMRIQYPTALDMPENVVWRRDIYREIDLTEKENAGLYDPVEPQGRRMNLFTYVFKLALNNYIPQNNRSQLTVTEHNKLIVDAHSFGSGEDVLPEGVCLLQSGQRYVPHQAYRLLPCDGE